MKPLKLGDKLKIQIKSSLYKLGDELLQYIDGLDLEKMFQAEMELDLTNNQIVVGYPTTIKNNANYFKNNDQLNTYVKSKIEEKYALEFVPTDQAFGLFLLKTSEITNL